MFRKLAATAAVTAALISPSALSLGLGDIDAESGLNQPLKAEITLLSSSNVSEEDLRAKLASYDAYTKFGVQREAYHNSLMFRIITKNDGTKAIIVESREPVKEPFLNFLIELNWAQGRLMREYTLLLDPPVFSKATPAVQPREIPQTTQRQPVNNQPTTTEPVTRTPEPQVTEEPASTETTAQRERQPEVTEQTRQIAATPEFNGNNWTVERGQTLWSIAKSVRPDGVSVQQTLMAIFHNNPEAFINNDINRMKAGAVLTVPQSSQIEEVAQAAAVNTIRNATVSDEAPLDVRKSVDETVVDDSEEQGGRLSIASVDEGASEESSGSTLDDDATDDLAQTDDGSSDNADDLGDTSSEYSTDLTESETATDDGLAIEDETMSVISGAADAADETDEVAVDEPAADIAEDDIAEDTLSNNATTEDDSSEVASTETEEPAETPETTPETTPQTTNSLADNTDKPFYEADNFWLYAGGGLVILLLIGGGLIYRRNTKEGEDDGGLLDMMTAANEAKPKKKRESFIGDNGMKAPKQEVDPVSSADIMIARGKLSEAENVLEDALAADPANQEVRVKLMEVVASQQNTEKFHQLKNELPEDFDHDSSLGLKVASLTSLVTPEDDSIQMDSGSDELNLPSEDEIFGNTDEEPPELDLSEEIEGKSVDVDTVSDKSGDDNSIDFTPSQDDEELVTQEDDSVSNDTVDDSVGGEGLSDDDAATKFDLAKAYMELGDDEAAKDILEEIKSEGNGAQRAEADKLLSGM